MSSGWWILDTWIRNFTKRPFYEVSYPYPTYPTQKQKVSLITLQTPHPPKVAGRIPGILDGPNLPWWKKTGFWSCLAPKRAKMPKRATFLPRLYHYCYNTQEADWRLKTYGQDLEVNPQSPSRLHSFLRQKLQPDCSGNGDISPSLVQATCRQRLVIKAHRNPHAILSVGDCF